MSSPVIFDLPGGATLSVSPGSLTSNLIDHGADHDTPYAHGIDGIESLVLAMSSAGIDLDTPKMREALVTAVEAVANQLSDE